MIGGPNSFVWPAGDNDYMKIILKEKPNGHSFRLIGTRLHPIGDFDDGHGMTLPDEPARIYRTRNGHRVFFTGRHGEPPGEFLGNLVAHGCDPRYAEICRKRGFYAVRVDPKEPASDFAPFAVTRLLGQSGIILPEWQRLIAVHVAMTRALDAGTVMV